jgi:2,4-dienoyl-CoA reductase-like NADH-dependent reductase (Old Yellow Enzyme family)/thioredoxin reductase
MGNAILTPAKIGPVEIKNRVIVSSMCLYYSNKNGDVTEKMISFFRKRAEAGIGAFVIPANPHGENKRSRGSLSDDSRIAQWKPLLDAIHGCGAKVFSQIHPSGIQFGRAGFDESPFELSTEAIEKMIESYAQGALRAKKAGFDGVEIHGAHGHEVALLLSELLNTRKDRYGGSLENCARNVTEMISRMKELCGSDFPVILRISGEERIPGGRTIEQSARICLLAEKAGVDAIHVSAGMPESEEWECPPSEIEEGHLAWMSRYLKTRLSVPVIVVGRIVDWKVGERVIRDGDADFVAVARTILADGDWMRSVGREDGPPIRKCIACNQGCRTRREQNKTMAECLQNPLTGREDVIEVRPDAVGRKVCVIGAGPAGLEAANILSQRGCEVEIYEKNAEIGGLFRIASMAPGKSNYLDVIDYYSQVLPTRNVTVHLNSELEKVPEGDWDLVVIASGGRNFAPPIDIAEGMQANCAEKILSMEMIDGDQFVVIGDGLVGYEVADTLSQKGKKVFLVGNDPRDPITLLGVARWHFMRERLEKTGVEVIRHSTVKAITPEGFSTVDTEGRVSFVEGVFEYILACGYVADEVQTRKLTKEGQRTLIVGNADKSGDAMDAIHGAFEKALAVTFE